MGRRKVPSALQCLIHISPLMRLLSLSLFALLAVVAAIPAPAEVPGAVVLARSPDGKDLLACRDIWARYLLTILLDVPAAVTQTLLTRRCVAGRLPKPARTDE